MSKTYDTYIHGVARQMIVRIHAQLAAYDQYSAREVSRAFFHDYGSLIRGELLQMSVAVRAKIASEGKGNHASTKGLSLEEVHLRSNWVNGSLSGEAIITEVAATAVVAAVYDLIIEDRSKRKYQPEASTLVSYGGPRPPAKKSWSPTLDDYDRWCR